MKANRPTDRDELISLAEAVRQYRASTSIRLAVQDKLAAKNEPPPPC
jgi:hypothetical protein